MNWKSLLIPVTLVTLILGGCENPLVLTRIDASSIPDQSYDVTAYKCYKLRCYAVLFDIPDDGVDVFMDNTRSTREMGLDSPRNYVDRFDNEVKHYSTIRIGDQNDEVRGYLVVSTLLRYWIRPLEDGIAVSVELDPSYRNTPR